MLTGLQLGVMVGHGSALTQFLLVLKEFVHKYLKDRFELQRLENQGGIDFLMDA